MKTCLSLLAGINLVFVLLNVVNNDIGIITLLSLEVGMFSLFVATRKL